MMNRFPVLMEIITQRNRAAGLAVAVAPPPGLIARLSLVVKKALQKHPQVTYRQAEAGQEDESRINRAFDILFQEMRADWHTAIN